MSKLTWACMAFLILTLGSCLVIKTCTYTVDERDDALVTLFGEVMLPVSVDPGIYVKNPLATVTPIRTFMQEYSTEPTNTVTQDKKNILISFYVKYTINDALKYAQTVHNKPGAEQRIDDIVYSMLKAEIGRSDFDEVITNREEIEKKTLEDSRGQVDQFGLNLIDFQIKRTDMPPQILESVYRRMTEERRQKAQTDRSEGEKEKLIAMAEADKRAVEIRSRAYEKKQILMGEGDEEALQILSEAYSQDVEFAMYVKTLDVYRETLKAADTRMILSTKNELLKYLRSTAPDPK